MAMRLLAVRRRSIEAIKRPNRVLEGRRPMDAVLDMNVPFLKWRSSFRVVIGNNLCIPNATNNRIVCIAAINLVQRSNSWALASHIEKGRRNPAAFGIPEYKAGLFGRLLPRRIERAGIVDLGDLVIAEAEHLAQDLVGVLAEQRGARHLAR
jgi:hypothetical protein